MHELRPAENQARRRRITWLFHDINETLNAANNKQASDIPIIFKRIQVWKAIRRSMKAILDHNWMPREYATAQEVSHDPLGIGKQELDIDEAMAYACSEMDDVTAERRAMLQKIFHYAKGYHQHQSQ